MKNEGRKAKGFSPCPESDAWNFWLHNQERTVLDPAPPGLRRWLRALGNRGLEESDLAVMVSASTVGAWTWLSCFVTEALCAPQKISGPPLRGGGLPQQC